MHYYTFWDADGREMVALAAGCLNCCRSIIDNVSLGVHHCGGSW